jgi:hypothetical protein
MTAPLWLRRARGRSQRGQAAMLLLGLLLAVVLGAVVLGGIARGIGARGDLQRSADLAALAAARAMHDAYPRVFEPAEVGGAPNPRHLERADYLALGTRAAQTTAARNGAHDTRIAFPGGGLAPIRVRVTVGDAIAVGRDEQVPNAATAEAELAPPGALVGGGANAGEYRGPFAYRQGKPMRSFRSTRGRPIRSTNGEGSPPDSNAVNASTRGSAISTNLARGASNIIASPSSSMTGA